MAPGVVRVEQLFVVTSASDKNGLSCGILAGYNYQVGQLVLGVEGDFQGWTVGEIRYTAVTGNFLTAHSKWGGTRLGYAADHGHGWRRVCFQQDLDPLYRNFNRRRGRARGLDRRSGP